MRRIFFTLAAFAAACADLPPEPDPVALEKSQLKNPVTLYRYWADCLHNREFDKAWQCLSAQAKQRIKVEEFSVAMTSYPEIRRMMEEAEVHHLEADDDAGTLRVCNPEFALCHAYRIVHEFKNIKGGIWSFDLTNEEIEQLTGKVLGWYASRDADGARHVYPPDYPHPRAGRPCPCGGTKIE